MTEPEKALFQYYFPNLDVEAACISAPYDTTYNCLAWTLGFDNVWLWPGACIEAFDKLYRRYGFTRATNGPIAAWGHSLTDMTHGSISGEGHGPRWESKPGDLNRIQHGMHGLSGAQYGQILAFYKRNYSITIAQDLIEHASKYKPKTVKLKPKRKKILDRVLEGITQEQREDFEKQFKKWKKSWSKGPGAVQSNPGHVRQGEAYFKLGAMDEKVLLPLLIDKLRDPDNFLALQLYDSMQPNLHLKIQIDPEDDLIFLGEQGRAQKTVETYLKNI